MIIVDISVGFGVIVGCYFRIFPVLSSVLKHIYKVIFHCEAVCIYEARTPLF